MTEYVHGYSEKESSRLCDQAQTLVELLHHDTSYSMDSLVLEAGCGVGAQTVTLLKNSPGANFVCIDVSEESIKEARSRVDEEGLHGATFQRGDIFDLPFDDGSFDHVFVCFVLEHLHEPERALASLRRVLKDGGTITVIEGDHGSTFFHPHSDLARRAVDCLVELQAKKGGNALIGRELYPILCNVGFRDVRVSPRFVYVDSSKPELVDGFTRKTFTAMVEGVEKEVVRSGMMGREEWDKGVADLYRTAEDDGTFCYTFFKAVAMK